MSEQHTYAGYTAEQLREAAIDQSPDRLLVLTPATVLALLDRIEELELVAERNELLWSGWKEKAKDLERERDTARLEGWQAALEMAAKVCDLQAHKVLSCQVGEPHDLTNVFLRHHAAAANELASGIRAMPPPVEWGDIGNPITEQKQQVADVALINEGSNWPHPDGFAGGLTERT